MPRPWRLTLTATRNVRRVLRMPRPCAVETHARGYKNCQKGFADATALRRGDSRSWLQTMSEGFCGCHGLAPRRLTFIPKVRGPNYQAHQASNSTGQARGILKSWAAFFVAASVKLHGASPWHLREF